MHTQAIELDNLASLARTALTDPSGIPEDDESLVEEIANAEAYDRVYSDAAPDPYVMYAVGNLDAIINTLNPAEWDRDKLAIALRTLGRHLAEVKDALGDRELVPAIFAEAADSLDAALDHIDSAIRTLEDEDE